MAEKRRYEWLWLAGGVAAAVAARRRLRARRRIDFAGRVVAITGGSRGLGLVMARQLVGQGARVALLARDADELERACRDLGFAIHDAGEVLPVVCDVTDEGEVRRAVDAVVARWGRLDVLINNAGIIQVGPLDQMEIADFERTLAVHFWGPLYLMRAALPHLRRGARIVNIASIGGEIAVPHLAPYVASKFALVGLSDAIRAEVAREGIRVTTVCPGLMRTGSHVQARFKGRHAKEYAWFTAGAALPGVSLDAERAARRILEAARYGDAYCRVGWTAKAAAASRALAPEITSALLAFGARLLPRSAVAEGRAERFGYETPAPPLPALLKRPLERAARRNNELH